MQIQKINSISSNSFMGTLRLLPEVVIDTKDIADIFQDEKNDVFIRVKGTTPIGKLYPVPAYLTLKDVTDAYTKASKTPDSHVCLDSDEEIINWIETNYPSTC